MKSTPVRPARIIVLSALPPPPPTPTTLILAPRSFMSSIDPSRNLLEELLDPAQKPVPNRCAVGRAEIGAVLPLARAVEQEPDGGGVLRALHHVGESTHPAGKAATHRQAEHLLRKLRHAVQVGRAAGEDRAPRAGRAPPPKARACGAGWSSRR